MERLLKEKKRLEIKRFKLETTIQNDWQEIQNEVSSGRILRNGLKNFFLRKLYRSNLPGSAFIAGGTHLAITFAERYEGILISKAGNMFKSATKNISSWLKRKLYSTSPLPITNSTLAP